MTKIKDDKKTIGIKMRTWNGETYSPDISADFFGGCAGTGYDPEDGCLVVKDVDYCIEQANDWQDMVGDYAETARDLCEPRNGQERCVEVKNLGDEQE